MFLSAVQDIKTVLRVQRAGPTSSKVSLLSASLCILSELARDLGWVRQNGCFLAQLLQTVHDN